MNQLLHLIIHSLYSHSEIFLRELISNSSDALDKLKYLTLTDEAHKALNFDPRIDLVLDEAAGTLSISDNGIGMNGKDLESHLGTIARSGTKAFLTNLSGEAKKDSNLIGQFGVGFYSVFMVSDKVEVTSMKAGEDKAWKWTSNGKDGYDLEEATRDGFGTTVLIHFNEEGKKDYGSYWTLQNIIKKYSNHIAFPIWMTWDKKEWEGEGENRKSKDVTTTEQINSASALWRRSKGELKDEDYKEFYKVIGGEGEDPLLWFHTKAEGAQEYVTLFYIPKNAPFDLYNVDYKPGVKLYVKRVFITDDDKELLPTYLRFLRGVIDSEDLPLNVSREILQQNKILNNIKTASVKKILGELKTLSENNKDLYSEFIKLYNRPLKEGLYQDWANKDTLQELVRFKSTKTDGLTSLAEYKSRMQGEQKAIYYITGGNYAVLSRSPLLESYKKKDLEVLILDDDIDEIVIPSITSYQGTDLKAINKSGTDDELKNDDYEAKAKDLAPLVEKIKKALGDKVKDVKVSSRLHESPSCVVMDESDPSFQMQQMMKSMGQKDLPEIKPILEINGDHEIMKKIQSTNDEILIADTAHLLLNQALLTEGSPLSDPVDFVTRLNRILSRAL